jgi:phosphate transport system permease protein
MLVEKSALNDHEKEISMEQRRLSHQLQTSVARIQQIERRGHSIAFVSVWIVIVLLLALLLFLTSKGVEPFLSGNLNIRQFFSTDWNPSKQHFGALSIILGSLSVTIGATLISAPLGISVAIFMTEIAPSWGRKLLQPATEILVGIPSVVYGFLGLSVIVPFIGKQINGLGFGLLAGILVLSLMILPTIISVSSDAITAVPHTYREASYALGATRWQTISRIVVRAAFPGLLTAVILGMARAFGEALAVQMVIGNIPNLPFNLFTSISTLTSMITQNMGNTVPTEVFHQVLWSMGLVLLLITLLFVLLIRLITKWRTF